MNARMLGRYLMAAALLAGSAMASIRPDADVAKAVRHEVLMYPYYSIWDDVSFRVVNGQVELFGAVTQPFKKHDIERAVQRIAGVTSVSDQMKVLPASFMDDRLRLQVARAIYRDPALSRYAIQAHPPIHIIVDNGRVTLTGVVNNTLEKTMAGMRAATAGLSFGQVTNNLQVENPPKKS